MLLWTRGTKTKHPRQKGRKRKESLISRVENNNLFGEHHMGPRAEYLYYGIAGKINSLQNMNKDAALLLHSIYFFPFFFYYFFFFSKLRHEFQYGLFVRG